MVRYTFRTKQETYYAGGLLKKGVFVKTDAELSKQYPDIFEIVGEENDGANPSADESKDNNDPEAGQDQETKDAPESSPEGADKEENKDEAKEENASEGEQQATANIDAMPKKELIELAEALHIEGAAKMNVEQLRAACHGILESK